MNEQKIRTRKINTLRMNVEYDNVKNKNLKNMIKAGFQPAFNVFLSSNGKMFYANFESTIDMLLNQRSHLL